jgi:hypothetical protein
MPRLKATWTRNTDPDAEYGSHIAEYLGHRLEVVSDRDGERWDYSIDDSGYRGAHDTMEDAMAEAEEDAEGN